MKQIVHIVNRDKFTAGYINFMEYYMKDYSHLFITLKTDKELDVLNINNVIYIESYKCLIRNGEIRKSFEDAYKIIGTGIFGMEKYLIRFPDSILKKTYFQFWGGDFYMYRNHKGPMTQLRKHILKSCIKKIAANIMLVDGDCIQISNILKIDKKYFVAPMPSDPTKKINYDMYRNMKHEDNKKRILVGNSSTPENQHIEMFEKLSYLKEEKDINIICPLSYGDENYREEVIRKGKDIFGNNFIPITEFMDIEKYHNLLSTCDIGIFNNNRQQALGNIWIMLRMGKKLYIRSDNSMWKHFKDLGFKLYDIADIQEISLEQLCFYDASDRMHNLETADSYNDEKDIAAWKKVLAD
ncbi:MAG: TDP-N-acetylfucosamine:lipid II N-acetylfucosaminyltransferase [Lachnospiraceae bacterium]|nr:TDP-N-acetylfucosamine:lipid II N-acetylfucosaminyltransferase [Lachnospiraceae bacterium]